MSWSPQRELPPDWLPCRRIRLTGGPRRQSRRARLLFSSGNINSVDDIEIESPHQAALQ
ncbi:hypothetical protein [Dickeya aquatica]|uniref:hypothetical protein n=1 Tax=Dickeya aquatica TaxID=1401087 RepID=UPI00039C397D|nr:hypothetical protein [Dickeya aquatica]